MKWRNHTPISCHPSVCPRWVPNRRWRAERFLAADPSTNGTDGSCAWEVDRELSRLSGPKGQERAIVVRNKDTGDVKIAVRGTKFRADTNREEYRGLNPLKRLRNRFPVPDEHTAEDLDLDFRLMQSGRSGNPSKVEHTQFDDLRQLVRATQRKYPTADTELLGHSAVACNCPDTAPCRRCVHAVPPREAFSIVAVGHMHVACSCEAHLSRCTLCDCALCVWSSFSEYGCICCCPRRDGNRQTRV